LGSLLNQYSSVWIAAGLLVLAGFLLLRRTPAWSDWLAFGVIGAGLLVAWLLLRPVQSPLAADADQVQAQIGQGLPVLLEFQSPY
jgi:hypothetical protein